MANNDSAIARTRRHARIRRRVVGTAQRPRLNVFRSLEHIYAPVSYTHLTLPTSDLV